MKIGKKDFSEIERPLKAILKSNGVGVSLKGALDYEQWLDSREGHIDLMWQTCGALAVAGAVVRFEYPLVAKPVTHYTLAIEENDDGLNIVYDINLFNKHRTIYKSVRDASRDTTDRESLMESSRLANLLGINSMTGEDVDVIKGVVQRRAADI